MKKPALQLSITLLVSLSHLTLAQQSESPGIFDGHGDVGDVLKAGSATYNPPTQEYEVSGAGYNVWFDHDEFQFLWKRMRGDFILYTRAHFEGPGVDPHRKMGWMARQSLAGNAPHVSAVVHGDGLTSLQFRHTAGAETEEVRSDLSGADAIQLERKGTTYTLRVARFGEPFVTKQVTNLDLGEEVYVGLFVSSHDPDVVEKGVYRDVRITVPAPDALVRGQEYIGSRLEVLDVASGDREIVYTDPESIQAPNWLPDGQTLLYNRDGLIYTFDLETRQPAVLNTGEVKNNNNDHVISFDGTQLGLSSDEEAFGGSVIYTVPIAGGNPTQVTPRGPSYLHGWSPDGKSLLFTGLRDGHWNIYRVPSDGGEEVRLTTAEGLDDGSEYSPDGQWIYFNSVREGSMRIWRMKPDGSQAEPLTDDEFHDWFPHVSPDGQQIVFLSFLTEEVEADAHPFYQHVYLRSMPANGGPPRVIAYLYGGQGTINTPSWSPDSKKVAFVSNTDSVAVSRVSRKR